MNSDQTKNGVGGYEAVCVERHGEFMTGSPSHTKVTDVAGLVTDIDVSPTISNIDAAAPTICQQIDKRLFLGGDILLAGVAEHVKVKVVTKPRCIEAGEHRFKIADHSLGQFVADT